MLIGLQRMYSHKLTTHYLAASARAHQRHGLGGASGYDLLARSNRNGSTYSTFAHTQSWWTGFSS
eukprot:6197156-Pleurochrysis_carterae.AAC.9